jgi:hypothetical protein
MIAKSISCVQSQTILQGVESIEGEGTQTCTNARDQQAGPEIPISQSAATRS